MDEYILPDGSINPVYSKSCLGVACFTDEHVEPILHIQWVTQAHIIFTTPSGRYAYKEEVEWDDVPYFEPNPYTYGHIRPYFAKDTDWNHKWIIIDTIKQIHIFKEGQ